MNSSSIHEGDLFVCPLCNIENRAAAKYCRRCGNARPALTGLTKPASSMTVISAPAVSKPAASAPAASTPIASTVTGLASANSKAADAKVANSTSNVSAQTTAATAVSASTTPGAKRVPEIYIHPLCPGCDAFVRTSDRFCCWCGESQPARPQAPLKDCPECAQALPIRANYCFVCGLDVGAKERLRMRLPTELFKEEGSEFFPTFDA